MSGGAYEAPALLAQYLHFHYAAPEEYLPWEGGPVEALDFPRRCAEVLVREMGRAGRVAELGCGVGRAALELSAFCERVDALDYSERFITAAERIRVEGGMDYEFVLEGGRVAWWRARCPAGARPERVRFVRGDACAPPEDWRDYDGVLLANVLCRLPDPATCLRHLRRLVRSGGVVLITTPCSWSEVFTPRERWLCRDGATLEGVAAVLGEDFAPRKVFDLPMLIREHARKYQWTVAQASVWERRG